MIKVTTPFRGTDSHGSGAFGASRGSRKHNGIDFSAQPNSRVHSVCAGEVTKLGYPYSDDLGYRYIQITDTDGYDVRYFYVRPLVVDGDHVGFDEAIGFVQDLDQRYKGITPHIHFEVKKDGEFVDPEKYLKGEM